MSEKRLKGNSTPRGGVGPFIRGYDAGYAACRRDFLLAELTKIQASGDVTPEMHAREQEIIAEIGKLTRAVEDKP